MAKDGKVMRLIPRNTPSERFKEALIRMTKKSQTYPVQRFCKSHGTDILHYMPDH